MNREAYSYKIPETAEKIKGDGRPKSGIVLYLEIPDHKEDPKPARVSLWEIHPVYSFEVCKHRTLATCRGEHDEDWKLLGGPEH